VCVTLTRQVLLRRLRLCSFFISTVSREYERDQSVLAERNSGPRSIIEGSETDSSQCLISVETAASREATLQQISDLGSALQKTLPNLVIPELGTRRVNAGQRLVSSFLDFKWQSFKAQSH